MRKVFLDKLPRTHKGVNWKNCIGYKINFIYDDIEDEIFIKEYRNRILIVVYENNEYNIHTNEFSKGNIGRLLGKYTGNFKVEIGKEFKDNKRNIIIVDREYRKRIRNKGKIENEKWYKYKCNKCKNEYWISESALLNQNQGCNVCCRSSHNIVIGINDMATTRPDLIKYLVDKEDANRYTCSSGKTILAKCPDCGEIKSTKISNLSTKGFNCPKCSDGISYPNKLMFNILCQLNIDFAIEYSPKWLNSRKFDFYIPSLNKIVEMDGGLGHGKKIHSNNKSTIEESRIIDEWKDEQAKIHGIEVIRIDCDYKDMENRFRYIQLNILKSELSEMFDMDCLDWSQANKYSNCNLLKDVCEEKRNNDDVSVDDLSIKFKLGKTTIRRYLKIGSELNWCTYNISRTIKKTNKKIEVSYNKKLIGVYESMSYVEKNSLELLGIKIYRKNIREVCNGKNDNYKGFVFKIV